jgi:hypothetical protein
MNNASDPSVHRRRPVLGIALAGFAVGCGIGLVPGVLSDQLARAFLHQLFRREHAAAVDKPITVERPGFRFQHAGNWSIDTEAETYDPDHMFSVHSPGHSFSWFIVADGEIQPRTTLDKHVAAQTAKVMKDATQTPFTEWGSHHGAGMLLTGRHLGLTPGTIRIFAFREQGKTFTVIESTSDQDRSLVQPGLDLIARTFEVKVP